jgi:hypothetical protein
MLPYPVPITYREIDRIGEHPMKISVVFALCLLCGCVTTNVVQEATAEKPIRTGGLSCTNPYMLEQDCSEVRGATRRVMVGNRPVAIAGSKDGTIVLVVDANATFNLFVGTPLLLNNPRHDKAVNENYRVIRAYLDSKSVPVKRVRPVQGVGSIDAYILELGSDGYSLLKELPVP